MKMLIADNDPVAQIYLEGASEDEGYEVVTAADGKSACDILLQVFQHFLCMHRHHARFLK